jgi:hypothetical protein
MKGTFTVSRTLFMPGLRARAGGHCTSNAQHDVHDLVQSPAATLHPCARAGPVTRTGYRERHIKLFYFMQVACFPACPHMLA